MHAIYIPVLRFALAHEGKMCRRNVLLEYLGEELDIPPAETGCCDVCSCNFELIDYQKEVLAAIQAVQEIPNYGERKVRLCQRCVVTVHQGCVMIVTLPYFSYSSPSGFVGQEASMSGRFSRQFLIHQHMGLLERTMIHGQERILESQLL